VATALEILDVLQVDVVVTDYAMPGRTGLDLVAQLRRDPRYADIECIVISGHARLQDLEDRARSLGARFLSKPVMPDTLVRAVAETAAELTTRI
jgi:CheY-like chemotaxis protein